MSDENQYSYTYSAKDQAEIKHIREKYVPKAEDKMEQLRRLDASVTKKGTAIALMIGIFGCLILGTGMSCIMVWGDHLFLIGVIIGMAGLIGISVTYPVYIYITKKEREKIAPEILKLSDELLK